MQLLLVIASLTALAIAAPKDPYPAPCGRGWPSGVCTTQTSCGAQGGFYVSRDCKFYSVDDIGCCYDIPEDK